MITADHLLNTTVELRRRRTTDDGMGGQESEWETVGTLPARVSQPATGGQAGEQVIAAQAARRITQRIYLEASTDVTRGDMLVTVDARELMVEAMVQPSEPAYRRADCVDQQEGI